VTGRIVVVGLGPGATRLVTPEATAALDAATDLIGYGPYLDRVPEREGQARHASDNREELDRARHALMLATAGADVAVVSSGDPGVFAMAAALFEAIEHGDPAWRDIDVEVVPGITAMLAAAARVGAPLGHDFCAINLSDNLKPWELIVRRLLLAAEADFAIALYNPLSRARPWQLQKAFELLSGVRPAETPVVFAHAVSEPDERIDIMPLSAAEAERADMRTVVLVGSSQTRVVVRPGGRPYVYTPRRVTR
jgi:precorrin-3B C17-methyltransferase